MPAPHFSPWQTTHRPCWHCARFDGMAYTGSVALCTLPQAPRVRSQPASGCSAWVREVGADDEPGAPACRQALGSGARSDG